jgi:hypothetical protein
LPASLGSCNYSVPHSDLHIGSSRPIATIVQVVVYTTPSYSCASTLRRSEDGGVQRQLSASRGGRPGGQRADGCVSIPQAVCLSSIGLTALSPAHLSVCLPRVRQKLPCCASVQPCIRPPSCRAIRSSVCLSVRWAAKQPVRPSIRQSVGLPSTSVHLPAYPSAGLPSNLSVRLSVGRCVRLQYILVRLILPVGQSTVDGLPLRPSVCPSVHLSACLLTCLSLFLRPVECKRTAAARLCTVQAFSMQW